MIRPRSRGTSLRTSDAKGGVSLRIEDMSDAVVSPLNGRWPVVSSYRMTPKREDVATMINRLALHLLRRHVRERADGRTRIGE